MSSTRAIIRKYRARDTAFLFDSYIKNNVYDKTKNSTLLPKDVWIKAQRTRLSKMIEQDKVLVVCLEGDEDLIIAWGMPGFDNEPYTYIKRSFKNQPENIEQLLTDALKEQQ